MYKRVLDFYTEKDVRTSWLQKIPSIFLIWIGLSVIAPHPDLFKGWFHLAVALPLLLMLFRREISLDTKDSFFRLAMVLLLYTTLNSLIISNADWALHGQALRWSLETWLLVIFLFLAIPPLLARPYRLGRLLLTCALLGSLASLVVFVLTGGVSGRLYGLGALSNPVQASSVLLVYLAMGVFLLWRERARLTYGDHALIFAALALTVVALLMSQSRGPLLALVTGGGYCLLVNAVTQRAWKLLIFAAVSLLLSAAVVLLFFGMSEFTQAMLERGSSFRLDFWSALLQNPPGSVLLGHGAATDLAQTAAGVEILRTTGYEEFHAHNLFVGTFADSGLVGVGILLAVLGTVLHGIYRMPATWTERLYLLGVWGLVVMLCLTDTHTLVISAKAVWLFTWLPLIFLWFWTRRADPSLASERESI
ncbi:MAG: O-antigen ligase family protein [Pseudohongiella sp.]|uniref:O-antigen ligase family protein n=1 Tax=Pseudohongiella sp. TaxID=1979412 RepID=UPI0034A012D9